MSGNPQKFTDEEGFALRLAAFYAALFVTLGVQLPFLPVWLAAKGLDASAIGLVLAVPMLLRVFAIPLAARAADRRDALRGTIVIAAAVAVVGYGALGFALAWSRSWQCMRLPRSPMRRFFSSPMPMRCE